MNVSLTGKCPRCCFVDSDMSMGFWPYCSRNCKEAAQPTVTIPNIDGNFGGGTTSFQVLYKVCPCGIGFYVNPNSETASLDDWCSDICKKRYPGKVEDKVEDVQTYPPLQFHPPIQFPVNSDSEIKALKDEIDIREKERTEFIRLFKEIYKANDIFNVKRLIEERFFR